MAEFVRVERDGGVARSAGPAEDERAQLAGAGENPGASIEVGADTSIARGGHLRGERVFAAGADVKRWPT